MNRLKQPFEGLGVRTDRASTTLEVVVGAIAGVGTIALTIGDPL